ncbi:DUF397 domain-containing protein [Streptomyces anulatus]
MSTKQPAWLQWFKSSYSSGECVEVATALAAVHVRDSKEHGGLQLVFTHAAWAGFVAELGRSQLN